MTIKQFEKLLKQRNIMGFASAHAVVKKLRARVPEIKDSFPQYPVQVWVVLDDGKLTAVLYRDKPGRGWYAGETSVTYRRKDEEDRPVTDTGNAS